MIWKKETRWRESHRKEKNLGIVIDEHLINDDEEDFDQKEEREKNNGIDKKNNSFDFSLELNNKYGETLDRLVAIVFVNYSANEKREIDMKEKKNSVGLENAGVRFNKLRYWISSNNRL